jgi:hypothetical protein
MKVYYERDGFYYTAMCPIVRLRRMDLDDWTVENRERNARYFRPGWDVELEDLGIIVRIEYKRGQHMWFIDTEAAASLLGCRPSSVEKYLEIMRHLRFIPPECKKIPLSHGFEMHKSRGPTTIDQILGMVTAQERAHVKEREHVAVAAVEEEDGYRLEAALDSVVCDESAHYLPPLDSMQEETVF